jgi:hypothetical protein
MCTLLELLPVYVVDGVRLGDGTAFGAFHSDTTLVEIEGTNDAALCQREIAGEPAKSGIFR